MTSREEILALLEKNKKLFLQELQESKELVLLLKKSIHAKLTPQEKTKVREQMLDICRAVPAFAIFMLPGGSLLLPILIKLIPNILPSSYRKEEQN